MPVPFELSGFAAAVVVGLVLATLATLLALLVRAARRKREDGQKPATASPAPEQQPPPTDTRALVLSISSLIDAGRVEEARAWIARAVALDPDEPNTHYNIACAYIRLGELENALDSLERIDFAAMANRAWMERDEELDPLRDHPRFRAMMARAR